MKKIIAIILIMLMLPCLTYAETTYRDAFSFCELYTQRLIDFETSTGMDIANISDYYFNEINTQFGTASCCAGSITIDPDNLCVREFMTEIYKSYADSDQSALIMSAVIAMSALEFSVSDELKLKYIERTDPINKAFSIYTDKISSHITNVGINKLKTKESIMVYQGNYTYYLQYFASTNGTVIIYLIAK